VSTTLSQFALLDLAAELKRSGPIPTVRVSSAQASCPYSYWGAVRYELRLGRDGQPHNVALGRASSDRRSYRLAEADAAATGRLRCDAIGRLTEAQAQAVLDVLDTSLPLELEEAA
jgi:hypothetical protein